MRLVGGRPLSSRRANPPSQELLGEALAAAATLNAAEQVRPPYALSSPYEGPV